MKAKDRIFNLLLVADAPLHPIVICNICNIWAGTFYPAVHSLELEGLIASKWEDNPDNEDLRRRVYFIPIKDSEETK